MGQVCCSGASEEKKDDIFHQNRSAIGGGIEDGNDLLISDENNKNYGDDTNNQSAMIIESSTTDLQIGSSTLLSSPGERLKKMREEQARLELIVQNAGRGMVAVRSTRGSTGYYDQGFAAALAQHLEQTTKFPDHLPVRLPPPPDKSTSLSSKADENKNTTNTSSTASPSLSSIKNSNNTTNNDGGAESSNAASSSNATALSSASPNSVYSRLSQPQWEGIALGNKGSGLAGCAGENPNTYMDHVAVSYLDSVVPKKERLFAGVGPMVENLL